MKTVAVAAAPTPAASGAAVADHEPKITLSRIHAGPAA